ncbi:TonB-dependent siderophore receptor [Gluconobacter sp. P1C6_b]|uniref:TonB-dependent receptor plug domain-containing protein n=1 Tax=Gluconobacter sp. P1C6_b TaxID=2762619 RepID=UPI00207B7D70|nr:TonB-dependent receptor [Gluconobacter sp. P1C6_b]
MPRISCLLFATSMLVAVPALASVPAQEPAPPQKPKAPPAAPRTAATSASRTTPDAVTATVPETVTVTANRIPQDISKVGSQVTVVTQRDIELLQRRDLADLLAREPGLNMVRTGGPGGTGSIFMRGVNSNEVKVRLDGMDINDPSTPAGAFDTAQFLTDGLARVEILRGPQSGLYGADAMGGVIDMTTKQGQGPLHGFVRLEGGSYSTKNQTAGFSGSLHRFHYMVEVSHNHVGDYQAVPKAIRAQVHDHDVASNRNDNRTANVRLGYDVTDNFDLGFTAHLTQADYEYVADDYSSYPALPSAQQNESDLKQAILRGTAHLKSFKGVFEQTLGVGYITYRRHDITAGDPEISSNRGDRLKVDWQGLTHLGHNGSFLVGYDYIRERIMTPVSAQTTTNAAWGQLEGHWHDILFGSANIRYDNNSRYGNYVTWRVAPAVKIPGTGLTLKASGGSGFHGPSLNQLFVSYPAYYFLANPNLRAERLLGFDAGFEERLLDGKLTFGADYYGNHVRNLINTALSGYNYTYVNVARAQTHGVEAFVDYRIIKSVDLRGTYTWTDATDRSTGAALVRRPRHKATASVIWTPTKRLSITPSLLYVSGWHDLDRYTSMSTIGHDYVTVNIAAEYKLADFVTLFARGDNLGNRYYENPVGYLQPGRSFYGGVTFGL